MSRISVKNLALNYPFYGGKGIVRSGLFAGHNAEDSRLLRNRDGRVLGVRALQGVSFEAKDRDRIALIGDNGSGKTSLLQVLAGIYVPDGGEIRMDGRSTAIVNINLGMSEEATGHRNITLRGLAAGHSREEIEEKRAEIAAFSELGEFLGLPVETYSSGMRMRLTFAIATAFNPDILILDEWLSAGDTTFREKATQRMKRFVDQAGVLILASHSQSLLQSVCNRALWLDNGRLRADGEIGQVLEAYREATQARNDRQNASMAGTAEPHIQTALTPAPPTQRRLTPEGIEPDLDQPLAWLMRWLFRKLFRRN